MSAAEDKARSQIMAIEKIHDIKFSNREEISRLISRRINDERWVLLVCTAINLWAASNKIKGEAKIPENLVLDMMKIKSQRSTGPAGEEAGRRRVDKEKKGKELKD